MINMVNEWWEFEGKPKKLPDSLVYRKKSLGFDMRFKVVKEFLADKRWKYRNPMLEMYVPKMMDMIMKPNILLDQLNG